MIAAFGARTHTDQQATVEHRFAARRKAARRTRPATTTGSSVRANGTCSTPTASRRGRGR